MKRYPTMSELHSRARALRAAAKAEGKRLSHQPSLNLVARECGDPNWQVLRARHPETKDAPRAGHPMPAVAVRSPAQPAVGRFYRGTTTADWLPGVQWRCYFGTPLPGPGFLTLEPWFELREVREMVRRLPGELRLRENGLLEYTNLLIGSGAVFPAHAQYKGRSLVLYCAPFHGRWSAVQPADDEARAVLTQEQVLPALGGSPFVFKHEWQPVRGSLSA